MTATDGWPSISVVIPTRDRPELLRETLDAIAGQDYPGILGAIVVFDRSDPDEGIVSDDALRPVRAIRNDRVPGAAGARNTGVLAATTDLVAFCDDTDLFLPGKTRMQAEVLRDEPDSEIVCCGLRLFGPDLEIDRTIPLTHVSRDDLLHGHMPQLHPSGILMRREAGWLFDEEIPGSYGEDYEFLLRAAGRVPVRNLPVVGVGIRWHKGSYFSVLQNAPLISSAVRWLLGRYDFPRAGYAHWAGKVAFAEAVQKHRGEALRWSWRTMLRRPLDARALLATVVALGVPPALVMKVLDRMGRGV
ncbi:glycosyltransferase family 2 protein [Actinocorallia longicatena]|uniref:Glycosyltransferase 2-like domain-containing protein n=1 Tax=Actinocorallia longicatena TaxID=111803 RepID=A0ABP6Q0D2_9ACTN